MASFVDSWPTDGRVFRRHSHSTPFPVLSKAYLREARAGLLRECDSGSSVAFDDDEDSDFDLSPVSTLNCNQSSPIPSISCFGSRFSARVTKAAADSSPDFTSNPNFTSSPDFNKPTNAEASAALPPLSIHGRLSQSSILSSASSLPTINVNAEPTEEADVVPWTEATHLVSSRPRSRSLDFEVKIFVIAKDSLNVDPPLAASSSWEVACSSNSEMKVKPCRTGIRRHSMSFIDDPATGNHLGRNVRDAIVT